MHNGNMTAYNVTSSAQIDREFLEACFAKKGFDVAVSNFSLRPMKHDGRQSSLHYLEIESDSGDAPSRLVTKEIGELSVFNREAIAEGSYLREYNVYKKGRAFTGVAMPEVYHAAYRSGPPEMLILMDDMTDMVENAVGSFRLFDAEQAGTVAEAFAALHSQWWNQRLLEDHSWLFDWRTMVPDSSMMQDGAAVLQRVLAKYDLLFNDHWREILNFLTQNLDRLARIETPVTTLIHGDAHGGNIKLSQEGEVWFLDWNDVGVGNPGLDLGKLLMNARDDAPAVAHRVLDRYEQTLSRTGISLDRSQLTDLACLGWVKSLVLEHMVVDHDDVSADEERLKMIRPQFDNQTRAYQSLDLLPRLERLAREA